MAAEPTSLVSDFLRLVPMSLLPFAISWFFSPPKERYRKIIDSDHVDDRKDLKDRFASDSLFQVYINSIQRANSRIQSAFGPPWTIRAFWICLIIAFIYPILLFFLSWIVSGVGSIGDLDILPGWNFGYRLAVLLYIILINSTLVFMLIVAGAKTNRLLYFSAGLAFAILPIRLLLVLTVMVLLVNIFLQLRLLHWMLCVGDTL